jgi:ATP-dependent Clp protease protease subunit
MSENSELIQLPIPMSRKIFFPSQVDQKSISDVTQKIITINESDLKLKKIYKINSLKYKAHPIEIYIDSYGGFVYQCWGLLSVMKNSKTPVHTIVTGCAMSCGFMMLISGHKRFAYQLSTPMFHQVSSGSWGKIKDMEEDLEETKRLQKMLEQITLEKTKITKKKLKEIYNAKKDWFMTAQEALSYGIIDEIIGN